MPRFQWQGGHGVGLAVIDQSAVELLSAFLTRAPAYLWRRRQTPKVHRTVPWRCGTGLAALPVGCLR